MQLAVTLLCLSALANLVLIGALFWMQRSASAGLERALEVTWNAEDTHMRVHALALEALEAPDSGSDEDVKDVKKVLRADVEAWEKNKHDVRDRFRQALR